MPDRSVDKYVHWEERPEFHKVYMPWCDRIIESDPVKRIVARIQADFDVLEKADVVFRPKLNRLETDIRSIEVLGEELPYSMAYDIDIADREEDTFKIDLGGHYSVMFWPRRAGQDIYKIGLSKELVSMGRRFESGHCYGPDPLIDDSYQRDYVEELVQSVAGDL